MGLLLAELSFDKYDHSDASREDCLLIVLVLAFLTEKESYISAINKVVVLSDTTDENLRFQENRPVLFVAKDDLVKFLKQFESYSEAGTIGNPLSILLLKFYQS